MATATGL